MYKIDLYDKKILYELDKNSAISISELSKILRKSKQFVSYRIKQLEKASIITGYNAIIDMSKLGFFTFRCYFKFQQMTTEDGEKFVDYINQEEVPKIDKEKLKSKPIKTHKTKRSISAYRRYRW